MPKRPTALSLVLSLVLFVVIGLVLAIAYLMILKALGRGGKGMDGLALAASLIVMPAAGGLFGGVFWLPLTLYRESKNKPLTVLHALAAGLAVGLVISFIVAGPSGFRLRGSAPFFGYFLTLIAGVGSGVGTLIVNRMRK